MDGELSRQRRTGLGKANEQLLLAAELTFDREAANRLADIAHRVGELRGDDGTDPDADVLATIDRQLDDLRDDVHADVRAAIVRAQELLSASLQ